MSTKKSVVVGAIESKAGRPGTTPKQQGEAPIKTLTQEAYRRLEEMIVTLELAPGEVVSEAILSRRLGIGTTPIREALLQLARENLVQIIPRSGVVVTAVDVRLQLEVLETRREIDRLLARASAKRATPAERQNIAELAALTEQAVAKGDVREFLRQDAQLNVWLGRSARNSVAMSLAGPLHSASRRFWFYHLGESGMFAVTAGLGVEKKEKQFLDDHDDYSAIMLKALADRLAEAFAERLHQRVRTEFWGYAPDEALANPELIAEKYRGIRPAPGYPACPDHTVKREMFRVLGCADIGMGLTESLAMTPAASVSGFYLAHPEARYFNVGRIGEDQLADWAGRTGTPPDLARRLLAPALG